MLTDDDFVVAKYGLNANFPDIDSTHSEYQIKIEALARIHHEIGHDKFELFFNLRDPRNHVEFLEKQHFTGNISLDEFSQLLKKYGERPIDIEMLNKFHDCTEKNISRISELLQIIITNVTDYHQKIDIEENEQNVDQIVNEIKNKYPINKHCIKTVLEYFEELRVVNNLGVLRLNEFTGTSAHIIAIQYINKISEVWIECRKIAQRSQTDQRYIYSSTASHLFYSTIFEKLPKPQEVYDYMREEFVKAKINLRDIRYDTKPIIDTSKKNETISKRFMIALSFPGEHRHYVEQVAEHLSESIGKDKILYDKWYESEFARIDLDTYLQQLYRDESELILVFICKEYDKKDWCKLEWRAIRDLIKCRESSIMPLRFDNTKIPGLFSTDGYVWIGNRPASEIANLILQRLKK